MVPTRLKEGGQGPRTRNPHAAGRPDNRRGDSDLSRNARIGRRLPVAAQVSARFGRDAPIRRGGGRSIQGAMPSTPDVPEASSPRRVSTRPIALPPVLLAGSAGERAPRGRLARTAARAGRAALETVLFLGVGGAMVAGALLLR